LKLRRGEGRGGEAEDEDDGGVQTDRIQGRAGYMTPTEPGTT
jgi:hypothetical protein